MYFEVNSKGGGRTTGDDKLFAWPSKNVYKCRVKSESDVFLP